MFLHGELQLTRQAVKALQARTQKAEERLTEAQDVGQLREQQMQREFVSLQRQISNGTRNLEISNHRGNQLNQQLELLRTRLKDVERLHQEERDHWTQKVHGVGWGLSKIRVATGDRWTDTSTTGSTAWRLRWIRRGTSNWSRSRTFAGFRTELEQSRSTVQQLETRNAELTQRLTEREQQATGEESDQWINQQQVLDSTLKSLEESLAKQDELEQQLASQRAEFDNAQVDPDFYPTTVGCRSVEWLITRAVDSSLRTGARPCRANNMTALSVK